MNRIISLCFTCVFTAVLGACAAPIPEKQQTESKPQAANQSVKQEDCEEVTGSRIRRCGGDTAGRSVRGGRPDPDAFVRPMPGPAGR
jgi:hypothetical protein